MVSELFHSPPGVLFTFPSRYLYTIGRQEYLALERGHPRFPQGFPCPVVLKNITRKPHLFAYGTITRYGSPFQKLSAKDRFVTSRLLSSEDRYVLQPSSNISLEATKLLKFGLFPVRSPLLRESHTDLFSSGYLDVSVPPLTSTSLCVQLAVS